MRNVFKGGLTVGRLKCVAKFNHHGKRSNIMNKGTESDKCLQCAEKEDCAYIVQCDSVEEIQNKIIAKMGREL